MKIKYLTHAMVFFLGSMMTQILYHIRFNNVLLREEMLIIMREGNSYGYFLGFATMDFFIIIALIIWILIIKRKERIRLRSKR